MTIKYLCEWQDISKWEQTTNIPNTWYATSINVGGSGKKQQVMWQTWQKENPQYDQLTVTGMCWMPTWEQQLKLGKRFSNPVVGEYSDSLVKIRRGWSTLVFVNPKTDQLGLLSWLSHTEKTLSDVSWEDKKGAKEEESLEKCEKG